MILPIIASLVAFASVIQPVSAVVGIECPTGEVCITSTETEQTGELIERGKNWFLDGLDLAHDGASFAILTIDQKFLHLNLDPNLVQIVATIISWAFAILMLATNVKHIVKIGIVAFAIVAVLVFVLPMAWN